jgi:hypothetical protein
VIRPSCEVCGKWKRRDHRCPGGPRPVEVRKTASTKRLPKLVHP